MKSKNTSLIFVRTDGQMDGRTSPTQYAPFSYKMFRYIFSQVFNAKIYKVQKLKKIITFF